MTTATGALVQKFVEAFAPLVSGSGEGHGAVHVCAGPEDAAAWIASVLAAQQVRTVVATARPDVHDLVQRLGADSTPRALQVTEVDPAAPPSVAQVESTDAGIGGADLLIAETASVLLVRSPQEPRILSLLPRVHVVVARAQAIVPRLSDALERVPLGADFVLITGASRTADVEKTLVVPAHGPGWLYVAVLA